MTLGLQIGDTLAEFLVESSPDPKLRQLMMSMAEAIRTIAFKVRVGATGRGGCMPTWRTRGANCACCMLLCGDP